MNILANGSREPLKTYNLRMIPSDSKSYPDEQARFLVEVICATITQAIEDWRYLKAQGVGAAYYTGQMIYRAELIAFFNSKLFDSYLELVLPDVTADDIRKAVGIPTYEQKERFTTLQIRFDKRHSDIS